MFPPRRRIGNGATISQLITSLKLSKLKLVLFGKSETKTFQKRTFDAIKEVREVI
jgi:hypothetical protein